MEKTPFSNVLTKETAMLKTVDIKYDCINSAKTIKEKLFLYLNDGQLEKFKEIFKKYKFDIETRDPVGNTPLNLAVQCNWTDIVIFLLQAGANVNTYNKVHNTPLHYAFLYKNFPMADLLIKNGAREDVKNQMLLTPWECIQYR